MPYVRCTQCALAAYTVSGYSGRDHCPSCGARLPVAVDPIDQALELARDQLEMDTAMLTELRSSEEVIKAIAGDGDWLGVAVADHVPVEDTYCRRLLDGTIEAIVADAQHDARVTDLDATRSLGIGAYIGVPLRVDPLRVYVLCCFAHEARPALGAADVRFLRGLGETVMAQLSPVA